MSEQFDAERASASFYRELFDATSDALFVVEPDGRIVLTNARACSMFGYTREQALELSIDRLSANAPPYTADHAIEHLQRAMAEGKRSVEWRCRHLDGHLFWAEVALRAFTLDGRPHIMASVRDIDGRKRIEAALRESEQRFETIFNSTSTMLAFTERELGRIIDVNEAWLQTAGLTREAVIGKTGTELGLWAKLDDRERVLAQLKACGRVRELEVELVMAGRTIPAQLSVQHIERNGERYILWEIADLTERKRAEAEQEQLRSQLLQAQKMESIGRLAGGIAHDFNNMLSAILGFGDLALTVVPEHSLAHGYITEMIRAGERAGELTKQLLAFSRKQVMQPRIIDPALVVRELEPMLRRLIGEDVLLQLSLAETSTIRADVAQLEQAIVNLVVNARDAMPDGGTLTLETANVEFDQTYAAIHSDAQVGPHVMIAVSDTGLGMDTVTRARAFEPFFTTKEPGRGTGLGLSTVYGIVKQSGGWVWLYSERERGTTIKLYFPQVGPQLGPPAHLAASSNSALTVISRDDIVVLLVEDDPQVRSLAATVLSAAGYEVLVADGPNQAIELSEQHRGEIHVLLTDVVMPVMNGRQLADRISARRPGVRVLFVSGYTENTVVHRGEVDEGVNFLSKPITAKRLLSTLERVLAN